MKSAVMFGVPMLALLLGGSAYAAVQSWRPVMPEFVVDIRAPTDADAVSSLILIYDENGGDPLRPGNLGADRRISGCQVSGSRCVSRAARKEFGVITERSQSLQVRVLDGKGNRIVGGVRWTGSWRPRKVRVTCDLGAQDVRKSCGVSDVTT